MKNKKSKFKRDIIDWLEGVDDEIKDLIEEAWDSLEKFEDRAEQDRPTFNVEVVSYNSKEGEKDKRAG